VREWKYWTRNKLEILAGYLPAFNTASQKSPERLYIDLMAGDPVNRDRDTREEFDGSARLALGTRPGFTKIALCERDASKAAALKRDLAERFAQDQHRYHVYEGDCNQIIDDVLHHLRRWRWAPTFAFVDQQAAEAHWATLEKLAAFRSGARKTEIWILASPAMITKGVHGTRGDDFAGRVDDLYGVDDWRRIQGARDRDQISPDEYRDEMVNLLRWRLEQDLGYAATERIPMHMMGSRMPIYDMVFATDHPVGQKIMTHLYVSAARREPSMMAEVRQAVRDRKQAELRQTALFEPLPITDDEVARAIEWTPTQPWDPTSRPWW
jgi:three-Cys-motif partner protein